ncbi:MAG: DUF2961 domain-containing protein [Bacteroidetes bacterium]|nr:DUF2961 domain-containing protein [Bacteroidota bacterium]
MKKLTTIIAFTFCFHFGFSQSFNGLGVGIDNLYRLSKAKSRSISAENPTGEKGRGGMAKDGVASGPAKELGQGWKVNPYVVIEPGKTLTLAEITGPGAVQHIWLTPTGIWRFSILRMYWDDESQPSVEVPLGDFFGMGWNEYSPLNSIAVCVNPGSAFNSYWVMPFRKKCKITIENINTEKVTIFYQVDYALTDVPDDAAYFHAQFKRTNPVKYKDVYTIVDNISGRGHYVGTYLAWSVHNNGWWGEGEIKFYIDGDKEFPTINGTGTEDYFCGSYDFDTRKKISDGVSVINYTEFSTPYSGLHQVLRGDGHYKVMQRFGMYRWHITDPIRFEQDLRVTIQDLGWRYDGRYLPQQSDISSVAFWYQTEPHHSFPKLPSKDELEVN